MKQSVIDYAKETGQGIDVSEKESRKLKEYGQWLEELNEQRIKEQGETDAFMQELTKVMDIPAEYMPLFRAIKKEHRAVFMNKIDLFTRYGILPKPTGLLLMYLNDYL